MRKRSKRNRNKGPLDGLSAELKARARKNLHLNVFAQWFRLIASGEKTEDYREMTPYWQNKLIGREYKTVTVRNGYDTFAPEIVFAYDGYDMGLGRPEWGAPKDKTVFIVRFGAKLSEANIEPAKKV